MYPIAYAMPAAPAARTMVLSFSICSARRGPSSSTSYQSAGLKFSMPSTVSPNDAACFTSARRFSSSQTGSSGAHSP